MNVNTEKRHTGRNVLPHYTSTLYLDEQCRSLVACFLHHSDAERAATIVGVLLT